MDSNQMQDAISQFESGDYRDAFLSFIKLYSSSRDKNEREAILHILQEAYYQPNEDEFKRNYIENCSLLKDYPFQMGFQTRPFEELPIQLFPVTDQEYCLFDKNKQRFSELRIFESDEPTDYLFSDLSQPVFRENECNLYHLRFLRDNVRRSEDYGGDNHIYLYYSGWEQLLPILLLGELCPLLEDQKFVFLIGKENRVYPLDFKAQFGIDYNSFSPKEPSAREIKRIIFGWKIANASGTSFLADIMDFHPDLLTIPDCIMYSFADFYQNLLKGKTLSEAISFLQGLPDTDSRKTCFTRLVYHDSDTLSEPLHKEFNRVSPNEFLSTLKSILVDTPNPSAKDWLIGIYLAYSRCHNRGFGRVVPALFMYPHDDMFYLAGVARNTAQFYFELVESFPYHKGIAVIRNPITQAGSVVNFMTNGHTQAKNAQGERQLDPFYCLAFGSILPKDYYFPMQHPLWKDIRVVRFEDLKLNPEATFASMCQFLNIPVVDSMFHTTWCGLTRAGVNTEGAVFDGFDSAPVYKSYDQYLSVFDKYRLELLLNKRLESYGYKAEYYDGQHFSDNEIIAMMELPFKCEEIETVVPTQQKRIGRQSAMQFIRFAVAIKGFPFTVNGTEEQFAPLIWLRPQEDKLRMPLFPALE